MLKAGQDKELRDRIEKIIINNIQIEEALNSGDGVYRP